jgi:D-alanyl-D-alanine carboxypeptidase
MASSDEQAAARTGTLAPSDYTDLNPSWAGAAGAAIATASELRVDAEALAEGRFLGSRGATTAAREREAHRPLRSCEPRLWPRLAAFGPMLGHTGALPGFQAFMGHDPQRHLTVVVLTNLQVSPSGQDTTTTIAKRLVGTIYSNDSPPTSDAEGR